VDEEEWQIADCWPIPTFSQSTDAVLPKLVITLNNGESLDKADHVLPAVSRKIPMLALGGADESAIVEELVAAVSAMRSQRFQIQSFPGLP
jgi:hypothetical protein